MESSAHTSSSSSPSASASASPSPELGELFHGAFRGLRRTWSEQLAPWDLTPHQWRALMNLLRRRPLGSAVEAGPAVAGSGSGSGVAHMKHDGGAPSVASTPKLRDSSAHESAAHESNVHNSDAHNSDGHESDGHESDRHESMRLKDLAERLRIAPRSATEVVDQLEAKGLVRREADPSDRRATLIVATESGHQLFNDVSAERREQSQEYFSKLDPNEQAELARLLGKLAG